MRTKRATNPVLPSVSVPDLCCQLRELQRQRVCNLKSRIMIGNRLTASVATMNGYHAGMEEADRKKRFDAAAKLIEQVKGGANSDTDSASALILATSGAIDAFDRRVHDYDKAMEKLAKQLPVAKWVAEPAQRGFGLLMLSEVIGECGDLNNYATVAKFWKRMGCAPYESRGKVFMPSTWRQQKPGLSAEEWSEIGYSPRRRSVAYLIGDGLVKQNGSGPYRARWLEAKMRAFVTHHEWTWKPCTQCKGRSASNGDPRCETCGGIGQKCLHAHLHGMLLATKMLLRNLWCAWTGNEVVAVTESEYVPVHA